MKTRDTQLKKLRPTISSIENTKQTSELELFQNQVLRPILKFQHTLLVELFHCATEKYGATNQRSADEKETMVVSIFQKDVVFRNQVIGIILGLFTEIDFQFYYRNSSIINRRISQMAQQRILSIL